MEMWACSVLLYSTSSRGSVCSPANRSHAVESPGFQSPHSSAIWLTTASWVRLPAALTDDVRRRVVALDVGQDVVSRRPGDRVARPGYLASQGMVGPQERVGEDVGPVAGVVLDHALLLVYDHALLLDVLRPVQGVAQHVDEQVDGLLGVRLRHLAPVGRELVLGAGVDIPADGLHGPADVFGVGPAGSTLEDEVLDEVG